MNIKDEMDENDKLYLAAFAYCRDIEKIRACGSPVGLKEFSRVKTKCMERYGLDPYYDRDIINVLSYGIKHGAGDIDEAANYGSKMAVKILERRKDYVKD